MAYVQFLVAVLNGQLDFGWFRWKAYEENSRKLWCQYVHHFLHHCL